MTIVSLSLGCATGGGAERVRTASAGAEPERRRADGVSVDPEGAPPPTREEARADARLVALRAPLGLDRVVAVVADLMQRIVQEDGESMGALFTRDAHVVASTSGMATTASPQAWWELRFKRLDYTRLAGEPMFREAELEVHRAGDDPEHAGPRLRLDTLDDGDVVVRVLVLTPRAGQDRLLGDEMVLWMRRDGTGYRIYRVMEDFQLN